MTITEAAAAAGAQIDGATKPDAIVTGVSNDTRSLKTGGLFVALAGERDGHEFLAEARNAGASGALVRFDTEVPAGLAALRCDDPLEALHRLAGVVRAGLSARVVAITGSAGKTCTKDFAATVAASAMKTVASQESFNNEIGVPLTICAADESTECLIVEIGSRGIGHISSLMPLVRPDIGVVTNVGEAHVGMFGSVDAIAKAKGEIVEGLDPGGCAVLNADDARVDAMADRTAASVLRFGVDAHADVRAAGVTLDDHARGRFTLHTPDGEAPVALPVSGAHMISNALAAAAVAHRLGIGAGVIAEALHTVTTSPHRMRILEAAGGWRVVNDAYNASPSSTIAALKTLVSMKRTGITWAVLGTMAELGAESTEHHDRIGRLAVRLGVGRIVVVGEDARPVFEAARLEGMPPGELVFVSDAEAAIAVVLERVAAGDIVLVKASRVAGLEEVAEAIR